MSFAKLLSSDAGVGSRDNGGSNADEKPASTRAEGLKDAARRLVDAVHAKDHEGVSAALSDYHEIREHAGLQEDPKSPQEADDDVL